ncbi:MAG: c-type cytochrome [Burkholderiales bacterium]|nr:c-type cytochrome [Burkholderiales bacterium]
MLQKSMSPRAGAARTRLAAVLLLLAAVVGFGAVGAVGAADDGAGADLVLPTDDATVALGKAKFGEKCGGFCHGAGGKGGRAPCLICGRFKHGDRNAQLVGNITNGIAGTAMGAFGEAYTKDEIVAIVAFLRSEQRRKDEAARRDEQKLMENHE